ESYLASIEKLVGEHGLYPSRSELIRVAVREFLIRELDMAERMVAMKLRKSIIEKNLNPDKNYVHVPIDKANGEYKTYKIVRSLE
ncbi:ribbon-helix-helix protein, CopG family, partial [Candidatus Aerophobetes bacterium]|nr:ribbon-helix-helix protein, CopG family [Candidatus Aerophobetes bacterium]